MSLALRTLRKFYLSMLVKTYCTRYSQTYEAMSSTSFLAYLQNFKHNRTVLAGKSGVNFHCFWWEFQVARMLICPGCWSNTLFEVFITKYRRLLAIGDGDREFCLNSIIVIYFAKENRMSPPTFCKGEQWLWRHGKQLANVRIIDLDNL